MLSHSEKPWRDTIALSDCSIIDKHEFAERQFVFRLHAPDISQSAVPGSFVHIQCDDAIAMRRPISILRANKHAGWVDILFKCVGSGTEALSARDTGESISVIGPIGNGFEVDVEKTRPLLIGGGVGIPPMIFLAEHLKKQHKTHQPLVLMGSEIPFPFDLKPSQAIIQGMPEGVIASMPLLEDWGLANRLASLQGYPGCYDGYVTDLGRGWLEHLDDERRQQVEVFACGPESMLDAVTRLACDFDLPCQVSMEEFMACAVGGCGGCVVEIETKDGLAMKRVCVDGPVFNAHKVHRFT